MASAPLPETCSGLTTLFEGPLLTILDWRCRGQDAGPREEWCSTDQVVFTRRGAWEHATGRETDLADGGTVTCWHRGDSYRVRHPVPGGDECTVFKLTPLGRQELRVMTRARTGAPLFRQRLRTADAGAYLLHRRLVHGLRHRTGMLVPVVVEAPALELVARMTMDVGCNDPRPTALQRRYVARAREVIAAGYRTRLSVAEIARSAGCSPFHLSRLFRRVTGSSLHRAMLRLRLRDALERLLHGQDDLSRVALDTGFASHSHFTDAFRAEFGTVPSAVRRWRTREADEVARLADDLLPESREDQARRRQRPRQEN